MLKTATIRQSAFHLCNVRRAPAGAGACESSCGSKPASDRSRGQPTCAVAGDWETAAPAVEAVVLRSGLVDYYSVLQVDDDANDAEIKMAYRQLAKVCHPDNAGAEGHNICILLNEAYTTLSNPIARVAYNKQLEVALKDHEDGFTGEALSKWAPTVAPNLAKHTDPAESRAVFVDENTCIGCKNCVWCAPATFRMEELHGRSRVFGQWLDTEEAISTAIDSCPVDCIHWVDRSELPALEYVCQTVQERVGVSTMMGYGSSGGDVFSARDKFVKERAKLEAKRKKAEAYSPMQEAARQAAAEDLAKQRGGWFGQFSHRVKQSFAAAAAGTDGSPGNERKEGARVGARRRGIRWDEHLRRGGGSTIPPERAMVPVMSKVEDFP